MKHIDYSNVELKGGFLYEKQILNENVTINAVYDRFFETGRIEAFECKWKEGMDKKPHVFWDSDVAKWVEGAAYILKKKNDPELEKKVEHIIDNIEKNQHEDGYFNIFFTVCEPGMRFTNRDRHELYCAGHLFEAACAYYEATGKDRFLKLMEKYVDCIYRIFVEENSAVFETPGHEEIELALVRMYRTTGKIKCLELAKHFIDRRGIKLEEELVPWSTPRYHQSHALVRDQKTAEGHCVRACYLYSGMADLALETGDKELYNACKKIFDDIVYKKMYITGALGSTRLAEAFTIAYDLRSEKAYAETCASIALIYFAHRLMRFENDSRYADIIERELYNGMIAGLSLDGKAFFYENPLEINLKNNTRFTASTVREVYCVEQRQVVFSCSCCPPNLNRVLASVGGYMYGAEDGEIFVNQFGSSTVEFDGMKVEQTVDYPKCGTIKLTAENVKKLHIRIPNWCKNFTVSCEYKMEKGYAVVENPTGEITIELEIKPLLMQSNWQVDDCCGKVAMMVGPYVCAVEAVDNIENLHSLFIDKKLKATMEYSDELCGYVVKAKGYRKVTGDDLYSEYTEEDLQNYEITFIPFASFANRGESNMCVWINVI